MPLSLACERRQAARWDAILTTCNDILDPAGAADEEVPEANPYKRPKTVIEEAPPFA